MFQNIEIKPENIEATFAGAVTEYILGKLSLNDLSGLCESFLKIVDIKTLTSDYPHGKLIFATAEIEWYLLEQKTNDPFVQGVKAEIQAYFEKEIKPNLPPSPAQSKTE